MEIDHYLPCRSLESLVFNNNIALQKVFFTARRVWSQTVEQEGRNRIFRLGFLGTACRYGRGDQAALRLITKSQIARGFWMIWEPVSREFGGFAVMLRIGERPEYRFPVVIEENPNSKLSCLKSDFKIYDGR